MIESEVNSNCIGIFYAIVTAISSTSLNIFFKMIKTLSIPEIFLIRSLVQIVLLLPFLLTLRPDLRGEQCSQILLWGGALISFGSTYFEFVSVSLLPIGDAVTIISCSPVIVMLLSHCVLKEVCGIYKSAIVVLLFIGISFIMKPPGFIKMLNYFDIPTLSTDDNGSNDDKESSEALFGYVAALTAATCLSISTLVRKKLSDKIHFSLIVLSCSVVNILGSIIAIPVVSSFSLPNNWTDIIYSSLVGFFNMSMSVFLILSLRRLPASLVSMVRSLEIVMAYTVQTIWFRRCPDSLSIVGAAAIMLSVLLMTQDQNVNQLVAKWTKKSEKSDESEEAPLVNNRDEE